MLPTLFHIPLTCCGVPLFGVGLLLAVWAVASICLLAWLVRRQGWNSDTLGHLPVLAVIAAAIVWLLPYLCDKEGLPIRGYGMMVLLGVLGGTWLAIRRGRRIGLDSDSVLSLIFWMFVPGVIGARAFYVIEYWPKFHYPTLGATLAEVANFAKGGLVVYGSLIGGLIGLIAFSVKRRLPMMVLGDMIAPCLVLGLCFGRIGCMLNGCCFAGVCDASWAVTFPWGSPPFVHQVTHGQMPVFGMKLEADEVGQAVVASVEPTGPAAKAGIRPGMIVAMVAGFRTPTLAEAAEALVLYSQPGKDLEVGFGPDGPSVRFEVAEPLPRSLPVHPSQLYSAINAAVLLLLVLAIDPFCRRDGQLITFLLTLYPITRFLLEVIRTDESAVFGTGMSISQNVSIGFLAAVIALWWYVSRRPVGRWSMAK